MAQRSTGSAKSSRNAKSSAHTPEPYAYESGFAVKWLIDAQISGIDSLNFDPDSGAVRSPWLSWGPYLWADGLAGRADSLKWYCSDFAASDGTHPATSARNEVVDSLLVFLHADATTAPWYVQQAVSAPDPPAADLDFAVAPNPAAGAVAIAFTPKAAERWRLEILDLSGRRVAEVASGVGRGARETRRWDPGPDRGAGVYWAVMTAASARRARQIVMLAGPVLP